MGKKFKRYNHSANRIQPGKGSERREENEEKLTENWCDTFGHRVQHGFCTNCGKDGSEIDRE